MELSSINDKKLPRMIFFYYYSLIFLSFCYYRFLYTIQFMNNQYAPFIINRKEFY